MMYIWQRDDWPNFRWEDAALADELAAAHALQARLLGRMEALGLQLRDEAKLATLTREVLATSEIEGERLDDAQVRSSVARRLGLDVAGLKPSDRNVDGVVEMLLDATQNYADPLTPERLKAWQASLFPTGRSGMSRIRTGEYRDAANDPMRVLSGPIEKPTVHFEAPPAERVEAETQRFIKWFNNDHGPDALVKSGVAHLWFVTIHPFEDGNGRIARAIADMALAQGEGTTQRAYSISSQIRDQRENYYGGLERAQKATMEITERLRWYLQQVRLALEDGLVRLDSAVRKARFWERFGRQALNERQIKMLERVMRGDWEGKLTSSKWAKIARCSQDTAGRDINDLLERGALEKNPGGGRSTSYSIQYPE
jgi:Fic family protein